MWGKERKDSEVNRKVRRQLSEQKREETAIWAKIGDSQVSRRDETVKWAEEKGDSEVSRKESRQLS